MDKDTPPEALQELLGDVATLSRLEARRVYETLKRSTGIPVSDLKAATADILGKEDKETQINLARLAIAQYGAGNLLHINGFWAWRECGVWQSLDDHDIRQKIHQVTSEDEVTGHKVDSVLKLTRTECYREGVRLGAPFEGVNLLNGELIYQGNEWQLMPHQRERYCISQLPVAYDPAATCPRFDQFLLEIFEGDPDADQKAFLLLAMMAYSMLPSCRYELFALLIGGGANGKSVLLDVLQGLLGLENVASVSPDRLDNPFQRGYLQGKLANVVTEIAEGAVINDAALKSLTSGEATTAEHKYRDPFTFQPYATCWFATNHMPHTRDFSDALFRRACVLTFNNTFNGNRRDTQLKNKLMLELPGILNRALDALGQVFQVGAFPEPPSMLEARANWRMEADQVAQFVDACCELGPHEWKKADLFSDYRSWANEEGVTKTLKHKSFTSRLARLGVDERRTGAARYYTGIRVIHCPQRWHA